MLLLIGTAAFAQQWQTLPVTGQLPANGVGHSAVFDPVTNKLIVYGGSVANLVPQNDVWILSNANGSSGPATWAKLPTSGGPARWAHSAVYDATTKRMMVFGGIDESIVRSSEAWVLSNADGTAGTPAWTKVASAGSGPVARREAYVSYDSTSNRLIVFGGENQSATELNDVWVLSNANGLGGSASWTLLTPAGTLPTIRGYGASVYDPSTNRLIIYGGTSTYDPETMLGDVWVLTSANGLGGAPAWIHLNPNTPSGTPPARSLPAMIYDSALNRAVIFGGYTTCSNAGPCIVTSDAWVLQNATGTDLTPTAWIPLSPSGTPSQNASFTPAVFDPVTDQLIAANDLTSIWLLSNPSARRIKTYDATPGTTPQVQGWPYSGDNGNPAPTVSGGALIENTTAGAQYWSQADSSLDLSQSAVLEAVLKIDSSNYIANIGTGTREGYYIDIGDGVSGYTIGLADSGFNINSITVPNQNLTPFPLAGTFHTYRLVIQNRLATFSIDGVVLASNIPPTSAGSFGPKVAFGGLAGASRSVSELRFLCYSTTSTDCTQALPDLTISKSHTGNFTQGQNGASYTINVSNGGSGPTTGAVSVTDALPTGLTATALAGTGWTCTLATLTCTRSDALAAFASYPTITLTVNVASNAPATVNNIVTVSGGGDSNTSNNSASNQTTVTPPAVADLTVTKTHTGSFTQGQTGAIYTITIGNSGTAPTTGTVTVTDTLPTGLTATALGGTGWSCALATSTCTRSDSLLAGSSYPFITVTVNVARNAPGSIINVATVAGGGEANTANDTSADPTSVAGINPTPITTGLALWLDASSGLSADGSTWSDRSGNGHTATALPGQAPTVLQNGLNGLPVAAFSGAQALTVSGQVITSKQFTIMAVVTDTGGPNSPQLRDIISNWTPSNAAAGNTEIFIGDVGPNGTNHPNSIAARFTDLGGGPAPYLNNGVGAIINPTQPFILSGQNTPTDVFLWQNSAQLGNLGSPLVDRDLFSTFYVGRQGAATFDEYWRGYIAELVIYNRAVTAGEFNSLVSYLTAKWFPTVSSDVTITTVHTGTFSQGQTGATYTITVTNSGATATTGAVTVIDTLPTGLTPTALAGTGWSCTLMALTCTRSDALASAARYPAITLTVNVASNAPASVTNTAVVSGGGELNNVNDSATDLTIITTSQCFVPPAGIIGWWSGDGHANDITGSDNATLLNGATFGPGVVGQAFSFGKTFSAAVQAPDAPGLHFTDFTIDAWVNLQNPQAGSDDQIFEKGNIANLNQGSVLVYLRRDTHQIAFFDGQNTFYGATSVPIGVWTHVVATRGGGASKVYINGTLDGSFVTQSETATDTNPLTIGAVYDTRFTPPWQVSPAQNNGFGGLIDEIHLFNRALSTAEIQTIVNAGAAGGCKPTSLVADLTVNKTHIGSFLQGQTGATYTLTATNIGTGPTVGAVSVADALPAGLTATAIAGTGWSCTLATVTCTRTDVLAAAASFPAITLTVNVASNAPVSVTNTVAVSGGGETNVSNDFASDPTTILPLTSTNLVTNGTFNTNANGWALGGGCGDERWVGGIGNPPGSVQLNACGESNSDPTASQTVTGLTPGRTYTVSVDVHLHVNSSGANGKSFGIFIDNEPGNPIFLGEFLDNTWHSVTANFTATSSSHLLVFAAELDARTAGVSGTSDVSYYIDNVTLSPTATAVPDLMITKSHIGNFAQGQIGATYTVTVKNSGTGPTTGTVTASDTLPTALSATVINGTGWSCTLGALTCTRSDGLAAGASYPTITVTVNVAGNASASVTNTATVSGGAELNTANDVASDVTTITPAACLPPPSGLVNWWPADGNANDIIGGANGTVHGTVVFNQSHEVGAGGFLFNGSSFVEVPGSSALEPPQISVAAWVQASSVGPFRYILAKGVTPSDASYALYTGSSGGLSFYISNGSIVFLSPDAGAGIWNGGFHHVVGTFDGSTTRLFVDGVQVGNGTAASTAISYVASQPDLFFGTFGADASGQFNWPGAVDEVQIFSRALSASEIQAIFAAGSAGECKGSGTQPDLTISKTHLGNFVPGQTGAAYTITVSNVGATATIGQVAVSDTLPTGLTATAFSGTGWTCTLSTLNCTRSDALAASASYPAITLTVNVTSNAPASVTNTAVVSGGGELNTANDTANDPTTIAPPPDLTVSKSHTGSFTEGQTGAAYTITVSNVGQGPTSGIVTVADTLPTGLTATAIAGTGWTCVLGTLTCTRSDTLAGGASYPSISLMVNVASSAPASLSNTVAVSGGGELNTANDTANDVTTVAPAAGISTSPGALDFAAVPITTSSIKSINITSTGLSPLTISSIAVAGNFYTLTNLPPLPAVLPPAGTVSFNVTFAPLGTISALGTVTLTSNATNSPTAISLSGSGTPPPLPPAAAITLSTDQPVYRRGQPVQISGKVTAANGSGISNVPVAVQVSLNGTVRPFQPYTDAQGGYLVVFQPTSTDGGAFSVTAVGTSGGATQSATKNFRIVGLLVSPNSLSQDQVMGSTVIVPLTLQNVGDATLSNLNYAVTVTPTGLLGATFSQSVPSLNAGATGTVAVVLTAPTGNPPPMPVGVQVNITATDSTSGVSDQESSSFVITLRPAVSTPMLTPTSLTVGVNPGKSLTRHFVVKNGGYLPMNNATVTLQDPVTFNWVSLGNASLGNLAAGDSREFDVMINPPANLAFTTYAVVFNVSGGTTPLQGTVNISVTQSTIGSAAFVVSDDIGAKVGGATVSLYGKTNGKMFQGVTGGDGSASIGGVDAGDYSYVVAASSHDPGTGSVTVTANASVSVNVLLSYDVVTLTFTVTPTTIVDQYNVTLNITYSTTLPKPALQVFPYSLALSFFPENAPNGQLACSLSITNTHPTASVRNLSVDASQLDVNQANGQRIHVLFANGVTVYQVGNLAGKATANVPCYATLDGGAVPTHSAGNIVVQANYDFSLDGQVLQGTTTTNVPVDYTRPSDLSYNPVRFIYDRKTDPANPVLKYDAGSFVYPVTSNRTPILNLLKPSGALFAGRNLVAFTETQGASTSIDVINANSGNVFWRTDFSSLKQSLLGNGDITTYDISTLDGGLTLQQVLAAQVAINPAQALNQPTYLGFEGQWADATTPGAYLIPVQIITLDPAGITIPRPPAGPTAGCLNPEDPQCKDPNPTFQAPVPSQDGQILLAFDQTIRLERQAFNAMLGIGARAPLTNTVASIQIRDASGNDASSKFFVLVTSDAMGATHGGTVSGQANVSWQLIPNAAAGGTSAQGTQYQVQARLNYVVSGTAKSGSTQVVTITVLPSPKLTVAYSAPFVVMAGKDAKIRVTLQNVGYGIARNLSIQSAQPRITASIPANPLDQLLDNPGPLVAFNLTGSSNTADGAAFQAGNLTINFGNVAPGATVSGYWTLQVSQKGFFIDINSTFTHTDYQGIQLDPLIVTPTTTLVPAIGGTITAASGQGIPNLTVALSQGGVAKGSDTTDISGVYYISDLASGNYLEQVTDLTGTVLASKNITVLGDQGTNFIDFVFQNYNPTQALILINSNPPGFSFTADGVTYQTPQSFQWAVGSNHTLGALNVAGPSIAVGWSDGETAGISSGGATASSRLALVANGASAANATRNITVDGFGHALGILTVSSDTYNRYIRTPVTPDPTFPNDDKIDHKWPSRNNRGDMVWSQKDPNNPSAPWQVWEQPSGGIRKQITFDQHSHERPVISDNGTIAWFQDSTGGGLGYAIMRLDPGSNSPSTIEYSSRKLCQTIYDSTGHPISSTCAPPQDAQEHDAGKNFGISSDGRTISYFTFFDNGDPTDRPFDINGQPLKDSSGNKVEFIGYDSPDINLGSALVYSEDFRGLGNIYLATLTQPLTSTTIDGPGNPQQDSGPQPLPSTNHAAPPLAQFPHVSDGLKPEIAYLKNKVNVNHWPGQDPATWVDVGMWADIVGTGAMATIAYERVVNGHSEIWLAKPATVGTINVTTDEAAATFTIVGPATYTGSGMSFSQPNAPPGTYTITFGAITGFATPPPQTQTLGVGGSVNFAGIYHSSLKVLSGDKQRSGVAGQPLPNPLVVQLTDQTGAPVPNIRVSFAITQQPTGASGTLSTTNTTSASDGTARTQLVIGTVAGQYQVTASCPDLNCTPETVLFTEGTPPAAVLLDPVPDLLSGSAVTNDTTLLSSNGRVVNGVAADGVSQLVLRITGALPNEHFLLTLDADGGLARIGTSTFQSTAPVQADSSGNAFALYQAPADFVHSVGVDDFAASRPVNLTIQSLDNPGVTGTTLITIMRPPVVLIHGVWSDSSTWRFFYPLVDPLSPTGYDARFNITRADYRSTNGEGFNVNAFVVLPQVINYIQQFKTANRVAAVQADIVAHSMGGDITRAFVLMPTYRRDANFKSGEVHKLITLDTPYIGSEFATNLLRQGSACKQLFAISGNSVSGAVTDLALGSAALGALQGQILPIPAHAILGRASPQQTAIAEFDAGLAISPVCSTLLPPTGFLGVFGGPSDLIVSEVSQQGQFTGFQAGSPPADPPVLGVIHAVIPWLFPLGPDALSKGILNGQQVFSESGNGQRVINLLNQSVQKGAFGPVRP